MDDPWGSPWAADDTQLKLDLPAPPPRIHTPQTPQKTASPWAPDEDEDDAWGGWNAPERGGGADSPGWGRSPARSPARSPGLRPTRSGTVSRHISPEPWARVEISDSQPQVDDKHTDDKDEPFTVDSAISLSEQPFAYGYAVEPISNQRDQVEEASRIPEAMSTGGHSLPLRVKVSEPDVRQTDDPESPNVEPTPAISSTERPEPTRQASKVQELVHHYDGIAKRKDSPIEPLVAGPRITLVGGDAANDDAEDEAIQMSGALGKDSAKTDATKEVEFEESNAVVKAQATVTADPSKDEDETKEDTKASKGEDESLQDNGRTYQATDDHKIYAKPPSIPYAFDLTHLDDLFPAATTPAAEPEPVPDVIIDDTFASISERKAWYRISRFGPMRRHNLGNDEDYVRLDWRVSEIRTQALRTVRRWMEEDSIAGRTVLGRRIGPGGASMFNWDSQAPQVEIGELLGKKGHGRTVSGASKGSRKSLASPSSATFAWSGQTEPTDVYKTSQDSARNDQRSSMHVPAAATFGWSTSPQEIVHTETKSSGPALPSSSRKAPSPIAGPPVRALESMDSVVAKPNPLEPANAAALKEADDEDDWGEMVSSPTWPVDNMQSTKDIQPTLTPAVAAAKVSTDDAFALFDQDAEVAEAKPPWTDVATSSAFADAWNAGYQDPATSSSRPEGARKESQMGKTEVPAISTLTTDILSLSEKPDSVQQKSIPPVRSSEMPDDDDALVANILKGLPDLSYMLR